jgi:hypothetical protein
MMEKLSDRKAQDQAGNSDYAGRKTMACRDFDAMSPLGRMKFVKSGGKLAA